MLHLIGKEIQNFTMVCRTVKVILNNCNKLVSINRLIHRFLKNDKFSTNKHDGLRLFCFVEQRLKDEGSNSEENSYFIGRLPQSLGIKDDHTPFVSKGW